MKVKLISSLEKCFLDEDINSKKSIHGHPALKTKFSDLDVAIY